MALKPIIQFLGESEDGYTFSLQDKTGLYVNGIPGGYGDPINPLTPNPLYTNIVKSSIYITDPFNKKVGFFLDGTTDPTAIDFANQSLGIAIEFDTIELGQNSTLQILIPGIYKAEYFVYFDAVTPIGTLTVSQFSKTVTRSTGDFTEDFADTDIILIDNVIYFIDKTATFTATTITLTQPFEALTATSFLVGYLGCVRFPIYKALEKALAKTIANIGMSDYACPNIIPDQLIQAYFYLLSIQFKVNNGEYEEAGQFINALRNLLMPSKGGCGCGC